MSVKIKKFFGFDVIGFAKDYSDATGYDVIPEYWVDFAKSLM